MSDAVSTVEPAHLDLPDLAGERFGGIVIACSDEFFGPASRMLQPSAPVFRKGVFDEHGQWMDGWETRRRRGQRRYDGAFDWAVIRLGAPGIVRAVVLDTAHFVGNQMESAALDGAYLPGNPSPEQVLDADWTEILAPVPLGPSAEHSAVPQRFLTVTHVRVRAAPDGGLARLRLHGEAMPDPRELDGLSHDVAAARNGGVVTACSDMHFGRRANLIAPGDARTMGEGWETRRRRGPGDDWSIVRLAGESLVEQVTVDTRHFRGNAPHGCELHGSGDGVVWTSLLPEVLLQPDQEHVLRVPALAPVSWVRLTVHPDGGVARLRVLGRASDAGRVDRALRWLSALPEPALLPTLRALCGSSAWVSDVAKSRPWSSEDELLAAARAAWQARLPSDWLEALSAHPRIGERPSAGSQEEREQSAAETAAVATMEAIASGNVAYEEKFGFTYVVRASGRSAEEMLGLLTERLGNDHAAELEAAAAQQWEISELRIARLLHGNAL